MQYVRATSFAHPLHPFNHGTEPKGRLPNRGGSSTWHACQGHDEGYMSIYLVFRTVLAFFWSSHHSCFLFVLLAGGSRDRRGMSEPPLSGYRYARSVCMSSTNHIAIVVLDLKFDSSQHSYSLSSLIYLSSLVHQQRSSTLIYGIVCLYIPYILIMPSCVCSGEIGRTTATHQLNKRSNRSHCIFTLYIEQRSKLGGRSVDELE